MGIQLLKSRFWLEGSASLNSFSSFSGEEVALYCAKYLPEIIKDQKAYKEGKLQKVRSQLCPGLSKCQHRGKPLCWVWVVQGGDGVSILGAVQNLSGHNPGQLTLGVPAGAGGWIRRTL